ncbi:hypothetical protein [Asticcacaulis sp. YBE204]|nr:hypothetical protein [Asticcacaulis sp. YBE204]ESQ81306.1 hypothetical protein AEYBE204_02905 [Asticcacaulis sp. YBE204]
MRRALKSPTVRAALVSIGLLAAAALPALLLLPADSRAEATR